MNDAPIIDFSVPVQMNEDNVLYLDIMDYVTDVEGDALNFEVTNNASLGSVEIIGDQFVYTPNANTHGEDQFTYRVTDSNGGFSEQDVTILIHSINDAPTNKVDRIELNEDEDTIFNIYDIFEDADGDLIDLDRSFSSSMGEIEWVDETHFKFKPNKNMNGESDIDFKLKHNGETLSQKLRLKIKKKADNIEVVDDIMDLAITKDQDVLYQVPSTIFNDVDGDAEYRVEMSDGSGLPDWLTFDATTLQFRHVEGVERAPGKYKIKLIAKNEVSEVHQTFHFMIANNEMTDGADTVFVDGDSDDVLMGGAGDDSMQGGQGADVLDGGEGDDNLYYEADSQYSASISAFNAHSHDFFVLENMNQAADVFRGGEGTDAIYLSHSSDALFLDDGLTDVAVDGARIVGIEEIYCGDGDDLVDMTSFTMTYGDITIEGEAGDDKLWTNEGNDTLLGGEGNDDLQGGIGNDRHEGGEGLDVIKGFTGDDTLIGGAGADTLTGGDGSDVFTFENISDSTAATGVDTITDFSQGEDVIDFSALGYQSMSDINVSTETGKTIITGVNDEFELQLETELALQSSDMVWAS